MYIKEIVLATHNEDKKLEMEYALRNLKVKILSLDNFPEIGEIDESGSTLLENSLIKAREVNSITGICFFVITLASIYVGRILSK